MLKNARTLLLSLLLALVGMRLLLPEWVKYKVNQVLRTLPDYKGHVERVHLGVWRGACSLRDVEIEHKNGDSALTIQELTVRIRWPPLLRGAAVADLHVTSPRLRLLVQKPAKIAEESKEKGKDVHKDIVHKTGKSLPDLLAGLMPFQIREFHVTDGSIRVQEKGQNLEALKEKDKKTAPEESQGKEQALEARVTHVEMDIRNVTNAPALGGSRNASGWVTAHIMKAGRLKMQLRLNPIAHQPTFDLDLAVTDIHLPEWNPLLRWQWGVDAKHGDFAMFVEAAAKEGGFKGYVKPFLHQLEMSDPDQDRDKSVGKKIKEAVVDVVASVFKNSKSKNVATRVPFEGRFDDPKIGLWDAVLTVIQNAFVKALTPRLDHSIH